MGREAWPLPGSGCAQRFMAYMALLLAVQAWRQADWLAVGWVAPSAPARHSNPFLAEWQRSQSSILL